MDLSKKEGTNRAECAKSVVKDGHQRTLDR